MDTLATITAKMSIRIHILIVSKLAAHDGCSGIARTITLTEGKALESPSEPLLRCLPSPGQDPWKSAKSSRFYNVEKLLTCTVEL